MRTIDPEMQAALTAGIIVPAILCQLTFTSGPAYVWSGVGPFSFGGNTFQGVGSLGSVGAITEMLDVYASGTTVTLSGIDARLYGDSMDDIITGPPAKVFIALLSQGTIIGAPYLAFSGLIDKPTVSEGGDTISITLNLENRIVNLQRANSRRYSSADQRILFPKDSGFFMVEALANTANLWGS